MRNNPAITHCSSPHWTMEWQRTHTPAGFLLHLQDGQVCFLKQGYVNMDCFFLLLLSISSCPTFSKLRMIEECLNITEKCTHCKIYTILPVKRCKKLYVSKENISLRNVNKSKQAEWCALIQTYNVEAARELPLAPQILCNKLTIISQIEFALIAQGYVIILEFVCLLLYYYV